MVRLLVATQHFAVSTKEVIGRVSDRAKRNTVTSEPPSFTRPQQLLAPRVVHSELCISLEAVKREQGVVN